MPEAVHQPEWNDFGFYAGQWHSVNTSCRGIKGVPSGSGTQRFFRSPKLSPVEQLYAISSQLTIRGNVTVQRLSGYPQLLA